MRTHETPTPVFGAGEISPAEIDRCLQRARVLRAERTVQLLRCAALSLRSLWPWRRPLAPRPRGSMAKAHA